jgi:hypothetical protein
MNINRTLVMLYLQMLACISVAGDIVEIPLVAQQRILFVTHHQYQPDHHNTHDFFPAAEHEFNLGKFVPGSALKIIELPSRKLTTLLETKAGLIRDPELDFDAKKVVFSMRRDKQDSYHIYEINTDGTGLKQLTSMKDVDDLDPIYLPDGHILFSSTREPKYCLCNRHIMANLYRMEPDGANIVQISKNTLFDNKPSLMPDGRILYTRWEYVDREQLSAQGLWVCNPDGTRHQLIWGNNTQSPGGVQDGHIIPDSHQQIVCTFSACHDRSWGAIAIINRALGIDGPKPVTKIWPAEARNLIAEVGSCDLFKKCNPKYEDPCPLNDPVSGTSGRYFICVRTSGKGEKTAIVLLDTEAPETVLHEEPDALGCFDPLPVRPRKRPPVIPPARRYDTTAVGAFYISNVYKGTHMNGIAPGDVKYLRVVETPEKRFFTLRHTWTAPAINWHEFNVKRVLGTVPVEEDGSAYFTVPSEKFVYFQLLDKDGMMIQSMRSGTYVQPGETQGCVGCHEDRLSVSVISPEKLAAMHKPPAVLSGLQGEQGNFNYLSLIQPILDRHCLRCHDYGKDGAKKVVLAGDISVPFNVSYMELHRKGYLGSLGAGPVPIQQPKTWGSHASKLIAMLRNSHNDVRLSKVEIDALITWVDINAPYYPSFACSYPDNVTGRCPLTDAELDQLQQMPGNRNLIGVLHAWVNHKPEPFLNFTRPALSPILQSVPQAKKESALAILQTGAARLAEKPRADMPGFKLSGLDTWREEKYQERLKQEALRRKAITNGEKIHD